MAQRKKCSLKASNEQGNPKNYKNYIEQIQKSLDSSIWINCFLFKWVELNSRALSIPYKSLEAQQNFCSLVIINNALQNKKSKNVTWKKRKIKKANDPLKKLLWLCFNEEILEDFEKWDQEDKKEKGSRGNWEITEENWNFKLKGKKGSLNEGDSWLRERRIK